MAIFSQVMQNDFTSKESLRLIERSFPEGTIYTIYALNLRFLFELGEEKDLKRKIRDIKLKSIIITWIKARYLQKKFELEKTAKRKELLLFTKKDSPLPNNLIQAIDKVVEDYKKKYSDPEESIKDPMELVRNFLKELINLNGEGFYFNNEDAEKIECLVCKLKNFEQDFNTFLKKGKDIKSQLEKLYETDEKINELKEEEKANDKSKESAYNNKIEEIKGLFDKSFPVFEIKDIEPIIKPILKRLEGIHRQINEDRRDNKQKLYNEIRRAEQFLASDEFGKFAKDPFFKISKSEPRAIEINGKKLKLKDVTDEENKLLQDGHEFSIFRGHLKDNWLNALTYKVENLSENTSYYIRLSKLGLLQIRREKHLGTYREKIPENLTSEKLTKKFQKSLEIFLLQNNLLTKFSEDRKNLTFDERCKIAFEETGIALESKDRFTKLYEMLKAENLIDILKQLLEHRKRYEKENEINNQSDEGNEDNKNTDDILQIAAGFAQLLEFKTNSNYTDLFPDQEITPLSLEDLRKKRKSLERQKYTVLLFNDIKKAKNKDESSDESFQPLCLKNKFPEAISCFLQGSLEEANVKNPEGIKVLEYLNEIRETGYLNKLLMSKLGIGGSQKKYLYESNDLDSESKKILDDKFEDIYLIPDFSSLEENDYIDLSTLKDELCIFTAERSLIFFSDKKTLESGNNPSNYARYWRCIVRGIEYTVALRATLQLLESRTTRLLEGVPEILELSNPEKNNEGTSTSKNQKENKKNDTKEAEKRVENLAKDLASVLKILPGLRSIAIPTNAFRSGHSVKKFDYLYNDCFNFEEIFGNIQKNIDELTNFLTFFEQKQEAKEDKKLSKIALLFTTASILYISVSFMGDFYTFINFDLKQSLSPIKILLFFIYIVSAGFVWSIVGKIDSDYAFLKIIEPYRKVIITITIIIALILGFVIFSKYYLM